MECYKTAFLFPFARFFVFYVHCSCEWCWVRATRGDAEGWKQLGNNEYARGWVSLSRFQFVATQLQFSILSEVPFVPAIWSSNNVGENSSKHAIEFLQPCKSLQMLIYVLKQSSIVPTIKKKLNCCLKMPFCSICWAWWFMFDEVDFIWHMLQ